MLVKPSKSTLVLVTYRDCSYPCKHCFCEPGPGKGNFESAKEVALKAYKLGYDVYFYASEPDERCFDVYKAIGQNLEECSICVRELPALNFLERLKDHIGRIGISLHGATKESHEFVGGANSYEKTIQAIKKVRKIAPKAKLNIWCAVNRRNMNEIKDLVMLARELGADYLSLMKMGWLGRAKNLPDDAFLTSEDVFQVVKTVEEICEQKLVSKPHITLISTWGLNEEQAKKFADGQKAVYYKTDQYCPAGRQHFTVDSVSKKVWPCHHLVADERFAIGRWTDEGLVIDKPIYQNLMQNIGEPCKSCDLLKVCGGGCRAEAIAEHMRLTGEYDPYVGLKNCRKVLMEKYGKKLEVS